MKSVDQLRKVDLFAEQTSYCTRMPWSKCLFFVTCVFISVFTATSLAQTTGSGATVLQNGATVNPQRVSQVRYANQFSGSDIGTQVNAAFGDCNHACQVIIPAGTYTWTTTITMAYPGESLIGAGAGNTVLNYTGSGVGLIWQMNPFTITPAGRLSGITIVGTASGTAGIHSGTITGAEFDDLEVTGFTSSTGACIWLDNVNGGWTERNVMSRVQLGAGSGGCTKGLKMTITGSGTNSFGYNRWRELELNVNASQTGISSESANYFYHSTLTLTCNATAASSMCVSITGSSVWDANVYNLVGENQVSGGTAIAVAAGSQFRGYGLVDFPNMALNNGNGGTFGGTFRILASPTLTSQDGGTISSFLGSGTSATVQPTNIDWLDSPEGFGIFNGVNIGSPYVLMYNYGGRNAFVVGTLTYGQPPSAMTQVARIDTGGNVHAAGAFYANGSDYAESVHVNGPVNSYEPGDVLGVDPTRDGRFLKTTRPYATDVAGVYSTKPGVLGSSHGLGTQEFKSEVPLAMTGIVPCRVTTENGPIRRGDLLVSSSRSGYAMKGTERTRMTGAVLGKALEPLDKGTGLISILISLQ